MAFSFDMLKTYPGGWILDNDNSAPLTAAQVAMVASTIVVRSEEYGNLQIKLYYKSGGVSYISLSRDSKLQVGDVVDLSKGTMQRLIRGNEECWKFLESF